MIFGEVTKTRTGLGLDWSILANSYRLMQARAYSDEIYCLIATYYLF